jgi:hypothetical protein
MMTAKSRWRSAWLVGAATVATLTVFAAGEIARAQSVAVTKTEEKDKADRTHAAGRSRQPVSRNVAGQQVFVDPATGRLRQPTPEEAQRLAEGLQEMLNDSPDGLEVIQLPDGTMLVDLQGRFENVSLATVDAGGGLSLTCVDNAVSVETLLKGRAAPGAGSEGRGTKKQVVKKAPGKPAPIKAEER